MADPKLESIVRWAPHPAAAPLTERGGDRFAAAANGTRTCVGGWQAEFSGIRPGRTFRVTWEVRYRDLDHPRDALRCKSYWGRMPPDDATVRSAEIREWDYLLPSPAGPGTIRFSRTMTAPAGAGRLTLRCTFRWATAGESEWRLPQVEIADTPEAPAAVRVAVVTGKEGSRTGPFTTVAENTDYYLPLCEAACDTGPDLIVLPEIALQWGIAGSPIDLAVTLPGPETAPFADLARRHGLYLLLGLFERDGDAVHNTAALIGPDGAVEGRYRKVHLAVGGESESGILPGEGFPMFDTEIGRIGCNICMDSSAAESSRMVGLSGADFLLLPIMGDHRASRWSPGPSIFSEDRWKAIMRTRAMDNQVCMVVARNRTHGSCVVNRKGDILAWNEGDRDHILATVDLADGYRMWNGGCFRDVNWMQRRPHLYAAYSDESNRGSLTAAVY
ncbi:MAG: carbon-nitrogen hydrolase family protein [Gemmatimonadota bacterium]|nr:carbon-nitrogen hydrolase family protein [Gemmatimonadota bacterium]